VITRGPCRSTSIPAVVAILLISGGCEAPFDRTPAGYAEACYGGREAAARNWVCSQNRLRVTVEATEADWPLLAKIVADYGRNRKLDVFDTSARLPYVRTVEVSACSSQGLFLLLDKRLYTDPALNRDGNRIEVHLRTYRDGFDWRPFADTFVAAVRNDWHGPVQVEWPEPVGPARALPDSVESCDE
jgi:hypothetical protein